MELSTQMIRRCYKNIEHVIFSRPVLTFYILIVGLVISYAQNQILVIGVAMPDSMIAFKKILTIFSDQIGSFGEVFFSVYLINEVTKNGTKQNKLKVYVNYLLAWILCSSFYSLTSMMPLVFSNILFHIYQNSNLAFSMAAFFSLLTALGVIIVSVRLSLFLPSIALNYPLSLDVCWRLTKPYFWSISISLFIVVVLPETALKFALQKLFTAKDIPFALQILLHAMAKVFSVVASSVALGEVYKEVFKSSNQNFTSKTNSITSR